jgi:hypothetical protein
MRQHFKGVVHGGRKAESDGYTLHKYVVIGLLVTDKEIKEFEKAPPVKNPEEEDRVESTVVIDADCNGLAELLKGLPVRNSKIRLGDADMILTSLRDI